MSQTANKAIRQFFVIERDTISEGGRDVSTSTKHVVAAAVFKNPLAGKGAASESDLKELADLSVEIGAELAARALKRFEGEPQPGAYGKAVIVGSAGEGEHGAALIHPRLGLSMRNALGAGPALIPGVSKVSGIGASIDLAFGDASDSWKYDAMDAIEVSVPGAPAADEVVLFVGFGTTRANARVRGATAEQVAKILADKKK